MTSDEADVRTVLAALNPTLAGDVGDPTFLGLGFASEAWLVRDARTAYALRIALDRVDRPCSYPIEHALMARLADIGAPVPSPVRGSWEVAGWGLRASSLTTFVPGVPLRAEAHGWAAGRIGAFVGQLQSIPITGFGPLAEVDGRLVGLAPDMLAGLRAWMDGDQLWPFDDSRLETDPALVQRPGLLAELAGQAGAVLAAALDGPPVIVHADLHEENILQDDQRLTFIDFGEAFIGSADWEYATMAYFMGWPMADAAFDEVPLGGRDRNRRQRAVAGLALSFGLHRWQQDRRLGLDEDAHDEAFLRSALARLRRRAT